MNEYVLLVAFQLEAETRADAHDLLLKILPNVEDELGSGLECWWVAEDDRTDRSDNDSAVFVHMGNQAEAYQELTHATLTGAWNLQHV